MCGDCVEFYYMDPLNFRCEHCLGNWAEIRLQGGCVAALFACLCLAIIFVPDLWVDRTTVCLMLVQQLALAANILTPYMVEGWMHDLAYAVFSCSCGFSCCECV